MRILIGTVEIANFLHTLAEELRRQGHEVTTVAESNHMYYSYRYDLGAYNLVVDYYFPGLRKKNPVYYRTVAATVRFMDKILFRMLRKKVVSALVDRHDLFIYIWTGLLDNDAELKTWKDRNKKVITLFLGSEIRDYDQFIKNYNITQWKFPEEFLAKQRALYAHRLNKVKMHERYSNRIFSVPDQSGLLTKAYSHLQIPINLDKINFRVSGRDIPLVIHSPSKPFLKGTDIIEATIERLKQEGLQFEYRRFSGIPHTELLDLLSEADILIDEIILHGPGVLSMEAMASGCAVATRFLEDSPACFRPPVANINADTIYEQLKVLITDKELRIRLAHSGKEYVVNNNSVQKVVSDLITFAEHPEMPFDYPGKVIS